MYIPHYFLQEDKKAVLEFMQRYSFATVISVAEGKPLATHLPVLVQEENGVLVLMSHFAKANQHSENILHQSVLTIFSEPHAYISPKFYEKEQTVPTWNYIAVHAYGRASIIEDEEGKLDLLEKTIVAYEETYLKHWKDLPDDFKLKMLKGITVFKIHVADIEAKYKLSQNKTAGERHRIIDAFSKSNDANENVIADYMKENS